MVGWTKRVGRVLDGKKQPDVYRLELSDGDNEVKAQVSPTLNGLFTTRQLKLHSVVKTIEKYVISSASLVP